MSASTGAGRATGWLGATAAFAIIGCTWALATARYGGPDEPAHVTRAAAAAHGDLVGRPVEGFAPGYRQVTVPAALSTGDPACYRHDEKITADCSVAGSPSGDIAVATSAGAAPPWFYVVVGGIARVFSSGDGVMAYRMASVVLCAIILGFALTRSRRAAWLFAALTPSAWFLLGVVGTSAIEIALVAVATVEAVARFDTERAEASLAWVSVPLAVCLVLRPAAFIDIAIVALLVIPTLPRPFGMRRMATLVGPVVLAGVASLAWSRWTGLVVSDKRTADSDSFASALSRSIRGIPTTVNQAIGALGWNEFFAPVIAQFVWVAVLIAAVSWTIRQGSGPRWHVAWLAAALVLPTLAEVAVHTRIGEIWQGRYSISFAMGGVLYAARNELPRRVVMIGIVAAAAGAEVLTLWQTLRRYMVGLDGSLTLRSPSWSPPLNPWLLIAMNAVAVAWLAAQTLPQPSGVFQAHLGASSHSTGFRR
ncbi:MAG: DUF2142 domain-containing protein [Ilumatobacteraceae bacterium]